MARQFIGAIRDAATDCRLYLSIISNPNFSDFHSEKEEFSVRIMSVLLCLRILWGPFTVDLMPADRGSAVVIPMKYEGGSLPLKQHDGVKVTLASDMVTIKQGKQTHSVAVKSINEISYGADVHRRVGAAIGVGVVTLGVGALMALVKTKKHFVGITWDEKSGDAASATTAKKGGVVFKVGKGEYRGFIAALEGLTGLKAVNADVVGTGGTSKP
jgi:hypothetical protein